MAEISEKHQLGTGLKAYNAARTIARAENRWPEQPAKKGEAKSKKVVKGDAAKDAKKAEPAKKRGRPLPEANQSLLDTILGGGEIKDKAEYEVAKLLIRTIENVLIYRVKNNKPGVEEETSKLLKVQNAVIVAAVNLGMKSQAQVVPLIQRWETQSNGLTRKLGDAGRQLAADNDRLKDQMKEMLMMTPEALLKAQADFRGHQAAGDAPPAGDASGSGQ